MEEEALAVLSKDLEKSSKTIFYLGNFHIGREPREDDIFDLEWQTTMDASIEAWNQGEYKAAEDGFLSAIRMMKSSPPGGMRAAESQLIMAGLYHEQGRVSEARSLYERSMAIRERILGSEDPYLAFPLNSLGNLCLEQELNDEAESFYRRVLEIRETVLGPGHPDVAISLNNLARVCQIQQKFVEAEQYFKRALAIFEKSPEPETTLAIGFDNLAALYAQQEMFEEAEELYKRAMAIFEEGGELENPGLLANLDIQTAFHEIHGRLNEAESHCKRALNIREKYLGSEHPYLAGNIHYLGKLLTAGEKYSEAESCCRRELEIREKAHGPDDFEVTACLDNLGMICTQQSKYNEAEPFLRKSLSIRERTVGAGHPDNVYTMERLAEIFEALGRLDDARAYTERAQTLRVKLEKAEKEPPPEIFDEPEDAGKLPQDLSPPLKQGINDEWVTGLEGRERSFVPPEIRLRMMIQRASMFSAKMPPKKSMFPSKKYLLWLFILLFGVGVILVANRIWWQPTISEVKIKEAKELEGDSIRFLKKNRTVAATTLLLDALAILEKEVGDNHPRLVGTVYTLASVRRAQRNFPEAEGVYQRILTIQEKAFGKDHLSVAKTLYEMVPVYILQRKYAEAVALLKRAQAVFEKNLGPAHIRIVQVLNRLAFVYQAGGKWTEAAAVKEKAQIMRKRLGGGGESRRESLYPHGQTLIRYNQVIRELSDKGRHWT